MEPAADEEIEGHANAVTRNTSHRRDNCIVCLPLHRVSTPGSAAPSEWHYGSKATRRKYLPVQPAHRREPCLLASDFSENSAVLAKHASSARWQGSPRS